MGGACASLRMLFLGFELMKKTIIRWIVIGATFIAALFVFSIYFNQGRTDMTVEMSEPSIPVAYIELDGFKVNEMHGYTSRMNASTIRDSITPIGDDREVAFYIDKYNVPISKVNVELRSPDGSRLIENTRIINYNDYNDYLEARICLKDLIDEGKEYNLIIVLTLSDGREIYYYTRVIQNPDANAGEKIAFAYDFCKKTFSKDNIKELATYMESNSEGDNTSFSNVNIHSSMGQLTWGELNPYMVGEPQITVREIGKTMASLSLNYVVSVRENSDMHYYDVKEYYRIRVTPQRTYLLSFNRTMDEIYVMDKSAFVNDKIMLGIQSTDINMMESEDGEILAFVNDGRLYCYNSTENKLERLFAFYDTVNDDYRNRYSESKIKILDVEENGNVSYLAYGYMNRGTHEGEVGVELFYYNSVLNTIDEQLFIPYYGSQDVLKNDVEKLSYINMSGELYIFLDGIVYKIDPLNLNYVVVADNINEGTFFASKSGKTIVWQNKDNEDDNDIVSNLTVMSLSSGSIKTVEKSSSEYVRPVGFMNEDLIYGISNESDLIINKLGDIIIPMNRVIIQAESGNILKEYGNEDIYVTEGNIEENQITLSRVKRDSETGEYIPVADDHITNNIELSRGKNKVVTVATERFEKITQIQLKKAVSAKDMKLLTPKQVIFEGGRTIRINNTDNKDRFVVYGDGEVVGIYDKAAKAVAEAYSIRGTVTDIYGNEIYRRGETVARNQIMAIGEESVTETKDSLAVCLDTMLRLQGVARNTEIMLNRGDTVFDILHNNLSNVYVLNLTGCTMDMMLYYVNQDIPVLAYLNDGTAVLIIGFNEQNVVLFDPEEGTIYKNGMNDSREMFAENGNRFMTYSVKNQD